MNSILADYKIAFTSRQMSLLGRKEVLGGKAKFGIFGDGKEVAQVALARALKPGDWRSGYYRDQTLMLAMKLCTPQQFFSQLYADPSIENDPFSAGRQMNSHFATRYIDEQGNWLSQLEHFNSSSDISPTAGQMARLLGLAYASKLYRLNKDLKSISKKFSVDGNEVAIGTIGNASTSEGVFWETMNAAGVLKVPLAMVVWDDGYGISVPQEYHTIKGSISDVMSGFHPDSQTRESRFAPGVRIYKIKAWDYENMIQVFSEGIELTRKEHIPCLFHVMEMTQPQGHSTSGSHERYKSKERLEWENSHDALSKLRTLILEKRISNENEIVELENQCTVLVETEKNSAWNKMQAPILEDRKNLIFILQQTLEKSSSEEINNILQKSIRELQDLTTVQRRMVHSIARRLSWELEGLGLDTKTLQSLRTFTDQYTISNHERYRSYLYAQHRTPLKVNAVEPLFSSTPKTLDGRQVLQKFFDEKFAEDPRLFVIGEDVGKIGGVNAEFEGLQEKYGELRVGDTGIREATILGQGIGCAMRGLRPIVEVQYLDYLLYALQTMSDDLACLHYRSAGQQLAPLIILTRGHRLEGIWHTGSPMGMILHSLRGIHVCVPRNMVQAAGFYNTLLKGDDPALVIEVLNAYRVKEAVPENLKDICIPLGVPEKLRSGADVTIVTYGACVKIVLDAAAFLEKLGIDVEVLDARSLLPFDRYHMCVESVKKTKALLVVDEDVPGGASAFILKQILEDQNAYDYLDAKPRTLAAAENRSAYASDGDYYCKPSAEDVIEVVRDIVRERGYPRLT